jgi:hypothetical protein
LGAGATDAGESDPKPNDAGATGLAITAPAETLSDPVSGSSTTSDEAFSKAAFQRSTRK